MRKIFRTMTAVILAGAMLTACSSSSGSSSSGNTSSGSSSSGNTSSTTAAAKDDSAGAASEAWKSGSTVYFDVPAKAGGGTDLYTRYITQALQELTDGVNFVVTNYDTGEVGAQHTKNAKPDGLTLTAAACTNMDNYLSGSSQVNPHEDLTLVGKVTDGGPQAWIAAADAPYSNMAELAEYIKANPGQLTVGCTLGGTSQLIWINTLKAMDPELVDMVNYVQCSSEADKLTNVASKAIDLGNCSVNNALSYMQDGKLKVLGTVGPKVATKEAIEELLGVELDDSFLSMPEQGIESTWDSGYYIMGPAGMDEATVTAINELLQKLPEVAAFSEGMDTMATFVNCADLETSKADFETEWELQNTLLSELGLNTRQ